MDLLWEHPGDLQHDHRVKQITKELELPVAIASVLVGNGVDSTDKTKAFFKPDIDQLHDPMLMLDMEKAVERIVVALLDRQRIVVYGDYDVDGVTSVSLLYLFLKDMGGDVLYHIPERRSEGYGLSLDSVDLTQKRGAEVLITVDTGVTAISEIARANELGIDVIVCDHHQPGHQLPNAYAILDPKREEDDYPFKELAAVGVCYKLCQALTKRLSMPLDACMRYIDLVAIGSAADIVPLRDENRILTKFGLLKLNDSPQIGVEALLQSSGLTKRDVTISSIVFGLAPRINAVGRLGSAERAVKLLTTKSRNTARKIAGVLEHENQNRKSIDHETLKDALCCVIDECDLVNDRIIVMAKRGWHSGVIGIVASRIIEKYHRPTVMITIDECGIGKGSARSIPGFDIYSALRECEPLLEQFGGHKYAAGLTIKEENVPELRRRLQLHGANFLVAQDMNPRLRIDSDIHFRLIDRKFLEWIKLFAPFGPRNQQPLFFANKIKMIGEPRIVGNGHLVVRLAQDGIEFDSIGYGLQKLLPDLKGHENMLDIIFSISENVWRGQSGIQLRLRDICPSGVRKIIPRPSGEAGEADEAHDSDESIEVMPKA
jgi:single-stranded-DNA-specific exonuclease